jgi:hypothetical protein
MVANTHAREARSKIYIILLLLAALVAVSSLPGSEDCGCVAA